MTSKLLTISTVLILLIWVSACDTQQALPEVETDSPTAFSDLLARAAAIEAQNEKAGVSEEQKEPKIEFVNQKTADSDNMPLDFASREEFEQVTEALEILAAWGEEPLQIYESLKPYLQFEDIVPAAELSLANVQGQVIIAGKLYQLDGERSLVRNIGSEEIIEEIPLYATPDRSLSKVADDNPCDDPGYGGNDECTESYVVNVQGVDGNYYDMMAVAYHDAYTTWTGTRRAKAITHILLKSQGQWNWYARGLFPDAWVKARLVNKDGGCEIHNDGVYANFGDSDPLKALASNGRDGGRGVSYSQHTAVIEGYNLFYNEHLEGISSICDGTTGGSQYPW